MKEYNFIYVGNAYPHKNLKRAIEAIKQLNKENKVIFKIVSSRNIFTERLEKLIKKLNVEGFVKLLGYVSDTELTNLYKNSTGFLSPSTYEGFGLPALEAMKAGTIVAASDIPVFKEVYGDNPVYFDPYSVSSIDKALEEIIAMPKSVRESRIKKAKDFIKKYSWAKMAQETLEVYNSV